MEKIKLVLIILVVSLFISGCVDENGDVTPVPTSVVTETPVSTPAVTAVSTPEPTPVREPVTFKSDVDNYYGFYKMVQVNPSGRDVYDYKNSTLTIYEGDTVIWINDAEDPEEKLTIVSEEGLWGADNISAILTAQYKEFRYTFTESGVYGVYIKEYQKDPRIKHQKIIVNP